MIRRAIQVSLLLLWIAHSGWGLHAYQAQSQAGAHFKGHVIDDVGRPLQADLTVTCGEPRPSPGVKSRSAADGTFEITMPAGASRCDLTLTHDGYQTANYGVDYDIQHATNPEYRLFLQVATQFHVLNARDGSPVAGAAISFRCAPLEFLARTQRPQSTDSAGALSTTLTRGDCTISADAPGFRSASVSQAIDDRKHDVAIKLLPEYPVAGTVKWDQEALPLGGVTIALHCVSPGNNAAVNDFLTIYTDDEGAFTFSEPESTCGLTAALDGFFNTSATVAVTPAGTTVPLILKRDPVMSIRIGQPSVWSLEDAHYLLARMRASNQDLRSKKPGDSDLDPNALHASRYDIVQQSFGASVDVEGGQGTLNALALQQYKGDVAKKTQAQAFLTTLREKYISTVHDLGVLQAERAATAARDPEDPDLKVQDAAIASKTGDKTVLEAQIAAVTTDAAATVTAPTLQQPAPPATAPQTPPPTVAQKVIDNIGSRVASPATALDASTVLDNYIQMQYEIIAKQLTLLRDETAENERVLFVELPHSVYSVPTKAREELAQVRWRIKELCAPPSVYRVPADGPGEECTIPQTSASSDTSMAARAVDIIPRRSALNVSENYASSKGLNLGAKFLSLFGGGASASFQRQHDILEQSVHQDIFASGFGKGQAEFGWTFGPMPGTTVISPGVYTTYAVLIVPRSTIRIVLEATGYHYSRKNQPSANPNVKRQFSLRVPGPGDAKFGPASPVSDLSYRSVLAGQRATVYIRGRQLSPQLGVLVNGTPLARAVSITDTDAATATPGKATGSFELVDSSLLLLSFAMPATFSGTPEITLVTPTGTFSLDNVPVYAFNGQRPQISTSSGTSGPGSQPDPGVAGPPMFRALAIRQPMFIAPLTISQVRVRSWNEKAKTITADLIGTGFVGSLRAGVNGDAISDPNCRDNDATRCSIEFPLPRTPIWAVDITRTLLPYGPEPDAFHFSVDSPLAPKIVSAEWTRYSPPAGGGTASATIVLKGSALSYVESVNASGAAVLSKLISPGTAVLELGSRSGFDTVVITFVGITGDLATTKVTRVVPAPPKPPAKPPAATKAPKPKTSAGKK